ncbi:MAG TPA: DUF1707 domain-containing protein [Nocardioidaceae bacterium]|nr:DUF1707 domain-containing protein [Nocardioidaceae bacterium]
MNQGQGDALLASDAERDEAITRISDAYAVGRLTAEELHVRSEMALAARTYGELDEALRGLGALERPKSRSVRQIGFWVGAVPLSVVILYAVVVVAFGVDLHDRFGGLVLLAAFVPMLLALYRWAWSRKQ